MRSDSSSLFVLVRLKLKQTNKKSIFLDMGNTERIDGAHSFSSFGTRSIQTSFFFEE